MEKGDVVTFLPAKELEGEMDTWLQSVNITSNDVIRSYKKAVLPLADQTFVVESVTHFSSMSMDEVILKNCDCDHRRLFESYFHPAIEPMFGV